MLSVCIISIIYQQCLFLFLSESFFVHHMKNTLKLHPNDLWWDEFFFFFFYSFKCTFLSYHFDNILWSHPWEVEDIFTSRLIAPPPHPSLNAPLGTCCGGLSFYPVTRSDFWSLGRNAWWGREHNIPTWTSQAPTAAVTVVQHMGGDLLGGEGACERPSGDAVQEEALMVSLVHQSKRWGKLCCKQK